MRQSVIVIGGGSVGTATAVALLDDGADVTLVDAALSRPSASVGNAGWVAVSEYAPWASVDTLKRVPRWLLDPSAPLSISPGYIPRLTPWMIRFLLSCRPAKFLCSNEVSAALCARAITDHRHLVQNVGAGDILQASPSLRLYRSRRALDASLSGWRAKEAFGVRTVRLSAEELATTAPRLSRKFCGAVRIEDHLYYRDPAELLRRTRETITRRGGRLIEGAVCSIATRERRQIVVTRDDGTKIFGTTVVLCAGAWSNVLARMVGDRIPLESERGYHIELPGQAEMAPTTMQDARNSVAITPMQGRLRLSTGVEFAGVDAPADERQFEKLKRLAREIFPDADTSNASTWMGRRPSTPDYLPVVGRSIRAPSMIYAFGHGHLGLTLAPTTARMVAALVAGRPATDALGEDGERLLKALAPERFRSWL